MMANGTSEVNDGTMATEQEILEEIDNGVYEGTSAPLPVKGDNGQSYSSADDQMTELEDRAQAAREQAAELEAELKEVKKERAAELRKEADELSEQAASMRAEADRYDPPAEDDVHYTPAEPEVLQRARGRVLKGPKSVMARGRKKAGKRGPGRRPRKTAKIKSKSNGTKPKAKKTTTIAGPSTEKPTPAAVLKLVKANPATPGAHIAATGGWNPAATMAILKTLEAEGSVVREGEKRGTKWSAV